VYTRKAIAFSNNRAIAAEIIPYFGRRTTNTGMNITRLKRLHSNGISVFPEATNRE
jgi:hypothetical protein